MCVRIWPLYSRQQKDPFVSAINKIKYMNMKINYSKSFAQNTQRAWVERYTIQSNAFSTCVNDSILIKQHADHKR